MTATDGKPASPALEPANGVGHARTNENPFVEVGIGARGDHDRLGGTEGVELNVNTECLAEGNELAARAVLQQTARSRFGATKAASTLRGAYCLRAALRSLPLEPRRCKLAAD